MRLIGDKAVLEIINPPSPEELGEWCKENNFNGVDPANAADHDHILAAALWYAKTKHPDAEMLDVCSFAGLVTCLATGIYGGFGTEEYTKERQAEKIVLALAGGTPAAPDGVISFIPELVMKGQAKEFTEKVFAFLDEFYFGDQEQAVEDLVNSAPSGYSAAQIILSMAKTQAQYEKLAEVADAFIRRKGNLKAVKDALRQLR